MRASAFSQLRRGVIEFCVLALLVDRERYGFELVRTLGETEGLGVPEGTVYPLLSRLRTEGLVTTRWDESPSGPPRRYYAVSEQGREALSTFEGEWRRFSAAVDGLLGRRST
jgi:PadR family transcriptional regulator PadR